MDIRDIRIKVIHSDGSITFELDNDSDILDSGFENTLKIAEKRYCENGWIVAQFDELGIPYEKIDITYKSY